MKTNSILSFALLLTSQTLWAGPITGGGTVKYVNRALCSSADSRYEIAIKQKDSSGKTTVTVSYFEDPNNAPIELRALEAKEKFVAARGQQLVFQGADFLIDIQTDQQLPDGAGSPGQVQMIINDTSISSPVACTLYAEQG
jgi:hypothetical protein